MPITKERSTLNALHLAVQAGEPLTHVAERNGVPATTLSAFARRASARVNVSTAPLWTIPIARVDDLLTACHWASDQERTAVTAVILRLTRGRARSHSLLGNVTAESDVQAALSWAHEVHGWAPTGDGSARDRLAAALDDARGLTRAVAA